MHIVAVSYHYQVFLFLLLLLLLFLSLFFVFFCVFCFSSVRDVLQHVNVTSGFDLTKEDRSLDN